MSLSANGVDAVRTSQNKCDRHTAQRATCENLQSQLMWSCETANQKHASKIVLQLQYTVNYCMLP